MHILFCNYEYPPIGGGGGQFNALLAEKLSLKHQVTVLTSDVPGLEQDSTMNGVRVIRVPIYFRGDRSAANLFSLMAYVINGYRFGVKFLRDNPVDIINTHFALPTGPVGDWLSRKFDIPNVLSLHGGDLYDPSKYMSPHRHGIFRAIIRRILKRADSLIAQSENTKENALKYYRKDININIIPLGIKNPPTISSTSKRSDYGLADDDIVWITVSRLVSRKAIDRLIHVFSNQNTGQSKLVIIGSGPQEARLRSICNELGIADQVIFSGFISEEDKFILLSLADIYVSTSQHEGFGISYLEAMACGLPVVCYDYGGQTDFLQSDKTGYIVELNNEQVMRDCCLKLEQTPKLRQQFGDFNSKIAKNYFIDACAASYENTFEQIIGNNKLEHNSFET